MRWRRDENSKDQKSDDGRGGNPSPPIHEGDPEKLKSLAECRANEDIARKIQALRTKAGLTQAQLAKLTGTTASAICRLEDADYEGHSVAMLRRIAAALNRRVEIRFLPLPRSA